jgi:hypothetical protein
MPPTAHLETPPRQPRSVHVLLPLAGGSTSRSHARIRLRLLRQYIHRPPPTRTFGNMKTSVLTLIAIAAFAPFTGCVSVEHEEPATTETTTTTRHVVVDPVVPATTTVERTTTY